MSSLLVNIVDCEEKTLYGVWKKSNDSKISNDINSLSLEYHNIVSLPKASVFPYFILSTNYDKTTKNFDMFIGSTIENENLKRFIVPCGKYAKITVKPKLGFLWGVAIREAKKYFYTQWLPSSHYESLNMEYEFHTEKSKGKHPSIDIIFAIK